MSTSRKFDFQRYVETQKNPNQPKDEKDGFGDYAFSGDVQVLRKINRLKPVRVISEATVRMWKTMYRNELLGQSVKVSKRQFPELYDAVAECATKLHIPMPTVYVTQNLASLNAGTYGTEDEAFIILNSALVDRFDDNELRFVIGHECGHIQNNHVVHHTAVKFLTQGIGSFIKWAVVPASLALNGWSRRAEITCDRAGLICCGDEKAAISTVLKLAVGSKKLYEQMDIDEYMSQLDELSDGVGRFSEYFHSHPYLPKRLKALQLFADSKYFLSGTNRQGGRALDEIDREIEKLISVV